MQDIRDLNSNTASYSKHLNDLSTRMSIGVYQLATKPKIRDTIDK